MAYTQISFYHFPSRTARWWAFKQMRLAYREMSSQKGLLFLKQLGTGAGNGFSIRPDWSVYAQLTVWEEESDFLAYQESTYYQSFLTYANGWQHFELLPFQAKGTWNKQQPFSVDASYHPTEKMAVITRASIKPHLMPIFWVSVPKVAKIMSQQKGLLFSKGIGEWPLLEQATFSVWEAKEFMQGFAYQSKEHRAVIKKTRKLHWYSEEMFCRFWVKKVSGQWPDQRFSALSQL